MKRFDRIMLRGYTCPAVILLAVLAWPSEGWSRTTRRACDVKPVVMALLKNWTQKLAESSSEKPEPVVGTYEKDRAVLLPTCANGPLIGYSQIKGYFEKFLLDKPRGEIDTQRAKRGPLRRVIGSVFAILHTRLELVGIELAEEKDRLLAVLFLGLAAMMLATMALIALPRPILRPNSFSCFTIQASTRATSPASSPTSTRRKTPR